MKPLPALPTHGIDRRKPDTILLAVGGHIENVFRTGEVRYVHPLMPKPLRLNARRTDAPRDAVMFVRRVIAQLRAT